MKLHMILLATLIASASLYCHAEGIVPNKSKFPWTATGKADTNREIDFLSTFFGKADDEGYQHWVVSLTPEQRKNARLAKWEGVPVVIELIGAVPDVGQPKGDNPSPNTSVYVTRMFPQTKQGKSDYASPLGQWAGAWVVTHKGTQHTVSGEPMVDGGHSEKNDPGVGSSLMRLSQPKEVYQWTLHTYHKSDKVAGAYVISVQFYELMGQRMILRTGQGIPIQLASAACFKAGTPSAIPTEGCQITEADGPYKTPRSNSAPDMLFKFREGSKQALYRFNGKEYRLIQGSNPLTTQSN